MKKILSFLILLLILPIIGIADSTHWKTYRFPTHPEYIFAFPSTYHVLYEEMPEDAPALSFLGITTEKAEQILQFNSAFVLAYTDDFSSFVCVSSFANSEADGFDFRDLTDNELEFLKDYFANSIYDIFSETCCTIKNANVSVFKTDYTSFIKTAHDLQLGTQIIPKIQYFTVFDGCDLIISFTPTANNELAPYTEEVDCIVQNFIPLNPQ